MYMCGGSNNNAMVFSRPYDGDSHTSSAVDCTLSLGPPATRLTGDYDRGSSSSHHERRPSSANWSASFCWEILQNTAAVTPSHKANLGGGNGGASAADPLLARRCANCDTTSTPLWRNGPRGPKSLCNACGIRFKKEERRANAAASGGEMAETHHYQPMINGNPWVHHSQSTHKRSSCYSPAAAAAAAAAKGSEFRFRDDVDDRDSTFLSWRLNVTDRAGLVHGFTR